MSINAFILEKKETDYLTCINLLLHMQIIFIVSFQIECKPGTFKSDTGNKPCMPCGGNSISIRTKCLCKPDHHRAAHETENSLAYCYSKFYPFIYILQ